MATGHAVDLRVARKPRCPLRPAIGVAGTGLGILRNGQIAEGIDCNGCVAPINPDFDPRFEGRATTAMQKNNAWDFPAGFPHRNSEPSEDAGGFTVVVGPGEKVRGCVDRTAGWFRMERLRAERRVGPNPKALPLEPRGPWPGAPRGAQAARYRRLWRFFSSQYVEPCRTILQGLEANPRTN